MPAEGSQTPFDVDAFVDRRQLLGLLCDVAGLGEVLGEQALADTSLTLPSSGLLITIDRRPGITIAALSRLIPKSQQTLGQIVARLEKLGMIERRVGPRRGIELHTTPAGHEAAKEAVQREEQTERRVRELLGESDSAALTALLSSARTALLDAR
jgi:DNA-binding MarR family transcriptional regulator